jgi:environmental stress-induced protein Ves
VGWRLSIARLDRSGPFSAFPGLRRHLVLASGAGTELDVGSTKHRLLPGEPMSFDGAAQVVARVPTTGATAVNLMTDPSRWRGALRVVHCHGSLVLAPAVVALVVLEGTLRVDGERPLGRLDAVLAQPGLACRVAHDLGVAPPHGIVATGQPMGAAADRALLVEVSVQAVVAG